MRLFNYNIRKKNKYSEQRLSSDFHKLVEKAIKLLSENEGSITDQDVMRLFTANHIDYQNAIEILLFLPITFVRHLLPNVKWPETYLERTRDNHENEKKYAENAAFKIIFEVTNNYFKNSPDSNSIIKIAGRSAEFHAINKLLNDNPNTNLEEVELTKTIIIR